MLDTDRPILSSQEDRLERTVFAKYLARCITDHTSPDSLVIGLSGGWASGKTSLINLILEELQVAARSLLENEKPIILNFSPWSYSGQDQIIFGFFKRLISTLRQAPDLANSKQIIQLLQTYASFFTQQQSVAWEKGLDPIQVKKELNLLLSSQKHKIIIVIDNISRLIPQEINHILQIVKSMADYANTVYLLTFDKEQMINAIDQLHPGEGREYIEKLIQLPFEVPPITAQHLEALLIDKLEKIVSIVPEGGWNKEYWADLYYSGLKKFFHNCRDITRFNNTLTFSYPRVKELVNPADFFALTALDIFAPEIFIGIAENKDLFTDLVNHVYLKDPERLQKDKLRCDEILARSEHNPTELLQLLMQVFPRLRYIYEPNKPFYYSDLAARKSRRASSPDVFDIYFRLSLSGRQMLDSEAMAILRIATNKESFDEALLRLNQDNRVLAFLSVLDGMNISSLSAEVSGNIVNALINSGDLFPEGIETQISFNTAMRIHRIIHQLFRNIPESKDRFEILKNAILNTNKSLYIIIHELLQQETEHTETDSAYLPLEHRDLNPIELRQLQELAVLKIIEWAKIGRLAEHPQLLAILYAWKTWGDAASCRQFVDELTREFKGTVAFLEATLRKPINEAISQLAKNAKWKDYLVNITEFIPLSLLEPRAIAVFENPFFEKFSEREQLGILLFLDLIEAKTTKTIPKTTF